MKFLFARSRQRKKGFLYTSTKTKEHKHLVVHLHTDWRHNVVPLDIISCEQRSQHIRLSPTATCCRALDLSPRGYLGIKLFIFGCHHLTYLQFSMFQGVRCFFVYPC